MADTGPAAVTQLLVAWGRGDRSALEELVPVVYDELKRIARRHVARERGQTLQATALVHEAYMRLVDQRSVSWQNRAHFFAIAARLMRRILMNHARARHAAKRGGAAADLCVDEVEIGSAERPLDLIALDAALTRLEIVDPRQERIVELRFFGGLSIEETAEALEISPATVKREWRTAKAWLYKEIQQPGIL
jgi:RNA polymerase sigma factor (TIGR02999 family)